MLLGRIAGRAAGPYCLAVLPDRHSQERKVSEMLHFVGLNVGKVAKLKLVPKTRASEKQLTCMFAQLKMVCGNKLQLFRHLSLRKAESRLRQASAGPKCRWNENTTSE